MKGGRGKRVEQGEGGRGWLLGIKQIYKTKMNKVDRLIGALVFFSKNTNVIKLQLSTTINDKVWFTNDKY